MAPLDKLVFFADGSIKAKFDIDIPFQLPFRGRFVEQTSSKYKVIVQGDKDMFDCQHVLHLHILFEQSIEIVWNSSQMCFLVVLNNLLQDDPSVSGFVDGSLHVKDYPSIWRIPTSDVQDEANLKCEHINVTKMFGEISGFSLSPN